MKKTTTLISFGILLSFLTSCLPVPLEMLPYSLIPLGAKKLYDDFFSHHNEVIPIRKYNDPETPKIIRQVDELVFQIQTGRILRSISQRDLITLQGTLDAAKAAIILLDREPFNREALFRLKTTLQIFDGLVISERDIPRLNVVLFPIKSLMATYANLQGVDLRDVAWSLFSYRFSGDIKPFGFPEGVSPWETQFIQNERYAIRTRGRNLAILLTPVFDLTKTSSPTFSLRHSYFLDEGFPEPQDFNRSKIQRETFSIWASTKYHSGDEVECTRKEESAPLRCKNFFRLNAIGQEPSGRDFNTIDSGIIDLSYYAGKKLTLAFVYENRGGQSSWAIERFNLYGISEKFSYEPIKDKNNLGQNLFTHDFAAQELNGLGQVSLEGTPGKWGYDSKRKVAVLNDRDGRGVQLLYTQLIDLGQFQYAPYIRLKQTLNFLNSGIEEDIQFVIAIDEEDGTAIEKLAWEPLTLSPKPEGNNWDPVISDWTAIPSEYFHKKIRLGWRHTSREGSTPAWQLSFLKVHDISSEDF